MNNTQNKVIVNNTQNKVIVNTAQSELKLKDVKSDFPIFRTYPNLVYLDNGATTQKPQAMLDALNDYYISKNSNIGRGVYQLADLSEKSYEQSRTTVAKFIGTQPENIIFTHGTTDSINQVAFIAGQILQPGQKIVLSIFEHHANILPWQRLAQQNQCEIIFIEDEFLLANPNQLPTSFWDNVGLVALSHVSNVTGQVHPIKLWSELAKKYGALISIDGAQGVTAEVVNLSDIACDFYSFSAHKLYGPMGVGVLYIDSKLVNSEISPLMLGGAIIQEVEKQHYSLLDDFHRFEAGTPNVANVYAFGKTLEYLNSNNWLALLEKCHTLNNYLLNKLEETSDIRLLTPKYLPTSHITSCTVKGIHAHDIGTFLSNEGIAVRVGKHCTYPLHSFLGVNSSVRASIGIYNTYEDIDFFIDKIQKAQQFFGE